MQSIMDVWRQYLVEGKTDCKLPNRGDIAEGIVAAAIAAKLNKRVDGGIGEVVVEDIIAQVLRIESMNTTITNTVPDLAGNYKDEVAFSIAMPQKPFRALIDPTLVKCLLGEYEGAAQYVNSPPMQKFALRLAKNNQSNEIVVKAAGTDDQKGTKVDIFIIVDGVRKRNLISLKVKGGDQFAQKTGKDFSVQEAFWRPLGVNVTSLQAAYEKLVDRIPPGKPFGSREEIDEGGYLQLASAATTLVYAEAYRQLQEHLDENRLEAEFVEMLADYITTGAVGPEAEFIELVKIMSGTFKRARFGPRFRKEMEKANLYPVYNEKRAYPQIDIILEDAEGNKEILVRMRAKVERASSTTKAGKRYGVLMRNYVETGPALYKLAGV